MLWGFAYPLCWVRAPTMKKVGSLWPPLNFSKKNTAHSLFLSPFKTVVRPPLGQSPVNQSSNVGGTLRHIDSIALRVEWPCQPCRRRIPWYFSRSFGHTNAEVNPTMPKMCTGSFHVLQRLNNSCAIYSNIYSCALSTTVKVVTALMLSPLKVILSGPFIFSTCSHNYN